MDDGRRKKVEALLTDVREILADAKKRKKRKKMQKTVKIEFFFKLPLLQLVKRFF